MVISYSGRGGSNYNYTRPRPEPDSGFLKKPPNPAHPRLACSYTRPNRGGSGRVTRETREFAIPNGVPQLNLG